MYSVVIAVCLLATPAKDCVRETAISWVTAPDHADSASGCMRHGMLYAATSNLVAPGSYAKIFCSSGGNGRTHAQLRN